MRAFVLACVLAAAAAQQITLQPCNRASSVEDFKLNPDSSIAAPGGQCIGISGSYVTAEPCTGDATQKWTWLSNGCVASVAGWSLLRLNSLTLQIAQLSLPDASSCWNAMDGQTSVGTPIVCWARCVLPFGATAPGLVGAQEMYQCGSRGDVAQNDLFYYDAVQSHIVGNESSLCFATASVPPGPPPPCASDLECSLNGKCDVGAGTCTCYEPWIGVDCSQFDILPAPPVRGYGSEWIDDEAVSCWVDNLLPPPPLPPLVVPDIYTWGGSVALLEDGMYHM